MVEVTSGSSSQDSGRSTWKWLRLKLGDSWRDQAKLSWRWKSNDESMEQMGSKIAKTKQKIPSESLWATSLSWRIGIVHYEWAHEWGSLTMNAGLFRKNFIFEVRTRTYLKAKWTGFCLLLAEAKRVTVIGYQFCYGQCVWQVPPYPGRWVIPC